jgi:hypothetical protein
MHFLLYACSISLSNTAPYQISGIMDKFETQGQEVNLMAEHYQGAASSISATSVSQPQVDDVLAQVSKEVDIERGQSLPDTAVAEGAQKSAEQRQKEDEQARANALDERIKRLLNDRQPQAS